MAPRAKTVAAGQVFPVIMAGGSGTRFWPLSRKAKPKQFLALSSRQPMLQETAARLEGLAPAKDTFVVCGPAHARPAARLLQQLPRANVLVEPQARNTAPAIALAVAHVAARNPRGVLVVLPSDQHVADVPGFQAVVREAVRVAQGGHLVTLGIRPTRPETGYGYIRAGAGLGGQARAVEAFVEKPDAATAQRYLAHGGYLWNAGIFVFRADVMLSAFAALMPELFKALALLQTAIGTRRYRATLVRCFAQMPATSIDYGVAEKAKNVAVVPGDFGWSDVGSFNALPEVRPLDAQGNLKVGARTLLLDTHGSVVLGGDTRVLAVVGMTDVVVVDAGDAVLVLPKNRSQDVRLVVEALKAGKLERFL